jgi:hypothetical protein
MKLLSYQILGMNIHEQQLFECEQKVIIIELGGHNIFHRESEMVWGVPLFLVLNSHVNQHWGSNGP